MKKVVFLLGRPGSGKSCAACNIKRIAELRSWTTRYLFDYQLLQHMFLKEEREHDNGQKRKFRRSGPEEYDGFDVLDFRVLDTVLDTMADQIQKEIKSQEHSERNSLFLIEFARDNYTQALYRFGPDILQNAHLVYLDTELETCIERVHKRPGSPPTTGSSPIECGEYNHYISNFIMESYYCRDDWEEVPFNIQHTWDIRVHPEKLENNANEHQALRYKVEKWVDDVHLLCDEVQEKPEQVSIVPVSLFPMVSRA